MEQGALGLSTSLQCMPDRFASTDEIVELAKVAARYGGVYFTHQRSESARIFESLDEVFAIAERAQHSRGDLAPEDRLQGELRQDAGGAAAHRGGARPRPRRDGEPVSVHPRVERPRFRACRCGRARAASTRRSARLTDPATRERIKKDMDDPNAATWENQCVRRERRRRRDAVVGAEPRPARSTRA